MLMIFARSFRKNSTERSLIDGNNISLELINSRINIKRGDDNIRYTFISRIIEHLNIITIIAY